MTCKIFIFASYLMNPKCKSVIWLLKYWDFPSLIKLIFAIPNVIRGNYKGSWWKNAQNVRALLKQSTYILITNFIEDIFTMKNFEREIGDESKYVRWFQFVVLTPPPVILKNKLEI